MVLKVKKRLVLGALSIEELVLEDIIMQRLELEDISIHGLELGIERVEQDAVAYCIKPYVLEDTLKICVDGSKKLQEKN